MSGIQKDKVLDVLCPVLCLSVLQCRPVIFMTQQNIEDIPWHCGLLPTILLPLYICCLLLVMTLIRICHVVGILLSSYQLSSYHSPEGSFKLYKYLVLQHNTLKKIIEYFGRTVKV